MTILTNNSARYITIGFANYLIGFVIFFVLVHLFSSSVNYNFLLLLSFFISAPISHYNQRVFVWKSYNKYFSELLKFYIVNIPTISFNLVLLPFFVSVLKFPVLETQLFLGGGIVLVTFLAHKYWTFK